MALLLAALLVGPALEARDGVKPSAERSFTGVIEKVQAKSDKEGTVRIRTVGDEPTRMTFEVDRKTKILRKTADPLEQGLKNDSLEGARVKVVYVDVPRKDKAGKTVTMHVCRSLQLIRLATPMSSYGMVGPVRGSVTVSVPVLGAKSWSPE
jgi:hypothetical protein